MASACNIIIIIIIIFNLPGATVFINTISEFDRLSWLAKKIINMQWAAIGVLARAQVRRRPKTLQQQQQQNPRHLNN